MYRINEDEGNVITISWLEGIVNSDLKKINQVWPYLTIQGFLYEEDKDNGAITLEKIVEFMTEKNYTFICIADADLNGYKDLIFKFNQA